MEDLVVQMGVVQERFGRDTADVEAGTSETTTLLDTDGLGEKSFISDISGADGDQPSHSPH